MRKSILFIISCLEFGGTEVQTLSMCQSMLKAGFKVYVGCLFEYEQELVRTFKNNGIEVMYFDYTHTSRPSGIIRMILNVKDKIKYFVSHSNPDIINVAYMTPAATVIAVAYLLGCRSLIATVHSCGSGLLHKTSFLLLSKYILKSTIFVSKTCAASYGINIKDCSERKYRVINNTLPRHIKTDKTNARPFENTNTVTLGFVGRLEPIKGFETIVNVLKSDDIISLPINVLIAGNGSLSDSVKELLRLPVWENRINYYGCVPPTEIQEIYDKIDILIVPSLSEAFGLSVLEGMASGCVIIASDIESFDGLLAKYPAICRFKANDILSLCNSIKYIISDRPLMRTLSLLSIDMASSFDNNEYDEMIIGQHNLLLS